MPWPVSSSLFGFFLFCFAPQTVIEGRTEWCGVDWNELYRHCTIIFAIQWRCVRVYIFWPIKPIYHLHLGPFRLQTAQHRECECFLCAQFCCSSVHVRCACVWDFPLGKYRIRVCTIVLHAQNLLVAPAQDNTHRHTQTHFVTREQKRIHVGFPKWTIKFIVFKLGFAPRQRQQQHPKQKRREKNIGDSENHFVFLAAIPHSISIHTTTLC